MIIAAIFSMFMSNTATAAMMLAILAPVLALLIQVIRVVLLLLLAIPVAANVGGMGTPIGTLKCHSPKSVSGFRIKCFIQQMDGFWCSICDYSYF